jgi:hypothetical protein
MTCGSGPGCFKAGVGPVRLCVRAACTPGDVGHFSLETGLQIAIERSCLQRAIVETQNYLCYIKKQAR